MAVVKREIVEGRQEQGVEEEITYTVTVPASWGTPTGTPTVKVYSFIDNVYADVTTTVMPVGSGSILGQVITLPELKSLTLGVIYRIEIKFNTSEGDTLEPYVWMLAAR